MSYAKAAVVMSVRKRRRALGRRLKSAEGPEANMRIATYNVNSIGARLPSLLRWLRETTPDVVCLQELKAPQEKFPEAAVREAGYGVIWHGQKSWNGVAILARGCEPQETRRRAGAGRLPH